MDGRALRGGFRFRASIARALPEPLTGRQQRAQRLGPAVGTLPTPLGSARSYEAAQPLDILIAPFRRWMHAVRL
jgi:hypothetical protein